MVITLRTLRGTVRVVHHGTPRPSRVHARLEQPVRPRAEPRRVRAVLTRAPESHRPRAPARRVRELLRAVRSPRFVHVPQLGRWGHVVRVHHRVRETDARHEHRRDEPLRRAWELEAHREHLVVPNVILRFHRRGHHGRAGLAVDQDHLAVHVPARRGVHVLGLLGVAARVLILQLVNLSRQRVARVAEESLQVGRVPPLLLVGQRAVQRPGLREQPLLVDPRQQRHRLPREPFPVHVQVELLRVKVDDGRIRILHQRMKRGRQRVGRRRGQHTHELLERPEGLAEVELGGNLVKVHEVRGEWRVVVGVVPVPRAATLVVVPAHPV